MDANDIKRQPPSHSSNEPDSFFWIFSFHNFMHDACDHTLTYEGVEVTKDILLPSGKSLVKGTSYETVYFSFVSSTFHFINWIYVPEKTEVLIDESKYILIPQSELAPFLCWDE